MAQLDWLPRFSAEVTVRHRRTDVLDRPTARPAPRHKNPLDGLVDVKSMLT